jgi:hypothetical protein
VDVADVGAQTGESRGLDRRVDELEALLATQQAVIDRLQQRLDELEPPSRHGADADQPLFPPRPAAPGVDLEAPTSRRALMTRGAAAAAGAAFVGTALSVANASPAAAASGTFDGDPGISSIANPATGYAVQAQSASGIGVFATSANGSAVYGQVTSANSTSPAVIGTAAGTAGTGVKGTASASSGVTIGVHGVAGSADGFGVTAVNVSSATGSVGLTAHGSIAVRADGTRSNLYLPPSAKPPFPGNTQSDPIRFQGELLFDTNKDLWMCVAPGSPGTWRRLAGRGTAGSLSLLGATTRVYDSRPGTQPPTGTKGIFASHEQRTIDCAAAGVPTDASAVLINATATNTNPGGFFAFFQDGKPWPNNSSLSWGLPKSTIANLAIVAVSAQRFTARMEGAGGADLIVDCIGYYQ